MALNVFITGRPGVGKTTVLKRAMRLLYEKGYIPGGVFCPEIRSKGRRIGFAIVDVATSARGILAHVRQPVGPRISKYRVNLDDVRGVGVAAISQALERADYVVIDEVGPMELFSNEFVEAVKRAVEHRKPVLGVIHWRLQHPVISFIKSRDGTEILTVTEENRDRLHKRVAEKLIRYLSRQPRRPPPPPR